jgi:hypothetical protein
MLPLPASQVAASSSSRARATSAFFLCFLATLLAAGTVRSARAGLVPGPDLVVGHIDDVHDYGVNGTQRGLGVQTTACNAGNTGVRFLAMPSTDHPVIAHNLYRMSGGSNSDARFEQIGQSWVKHTYGASNEDECSFFCVSTGDDLGPGCSDTYLSNQNAAQNDLGSRAWVNPFTGVFQSNARDHTGHTHTGTSHRLAVEENDLNTTINPGATFYGEVQYITPNEYSWCQTHPGQCNMQNNASYRRFTVTQNFTFSAVGSTIRTASALNAWTGATIRPIEPEPGIDGRAFIAWKVTNPAAGVWHYEYAIYNQNLDRAIESFSVPLGCGIALSNLGFHAPLNEPGSAHDGTLGDAGFSNNAWTSNQTTNALTWSTETFTQNQNANAIRWGTLYNFRFDSDRAPLFTEATIGFFKTGAPVTIGIMAPNACDVTPSPTPTATATATATPPNPTPTGTPGPLPTPTPGGTPVGPVNISTRMRVEPGENAAIAGFIIPRRSNGNSLTVSVVIRALGPSLTAFGVPGALADPVLELHGDAPFVTVVNDDWRADAEAATVEDRGLGPSSDVESSIARTLSTGNYTAIVRGKNGTSGIALVEIYASAHPILPNMSTRAFVHSGDDVVIAGVIMGGPGSYTGPGKIAVRGLGPRVAIFGVENYLADPKLELRNNNGALLLVNDSWQADPIQAAELNAAGLGVMHPLEAGMAVLLPRGLYTALLSGADGGTGVGLIEVYNIDGPLVGAVSSAPSR